jgi:hypothetical protein
MASHINGGVPAALQAQYRTQLDAISQQAERLKKLDKPELVTGMLEASLVATVETYAPNSELSAYTSMLQGVTQQLDQFSFGAKLSQGLWETALKVAANGIPGGAGVALAKTVEHSAKEWEPFYGASVAQLALLEMRTGHGQTLKGENIHATVALDAANKQDNIEHRDAIVSNAVSLVADTESWNIA